MTGAKTAGGAGAGSLNEVRLAGTVTGAPEVRVLPSGDPIVVFRLSVRRRPSPMTRASRQQVDVVDCCAWSASARRAAQRLRVGDRAEVDGALRRRFFRTGGGAASRVEVEVDKVRRR